MIRICHILTDTNVGGAGVLLSNLLSSMDRGRFSLSVLLPEGSLIAERLSACEGVDVRMIPIQGDRSFSLSAIPVIYRALRKLSPDVVHTHGAFSGRVAARLLRVPRVFVTRHCAWDDTPFFHGFRRLVSSVAARLFGDLYIATADAAARNLRAMGVPEARTVTVKNGSPARQRLSAAARDSFRRSYGIPRDAFLVTVTARLSREKGVDTLLRAAVRLVEKDDLYRFLIVGSGSEEKRLFADAARYGIEKYVIFTGFLPDTTEALSASDVLVNPSRGTETSCLAISEAMSMGLPVIASDFGGNTEMVRDGESGLLFPVDSASELTAQIERLRTSDTLRERLSNGAVAAYLREFTLDGMTHTYETLYELAMQ